MNSHPRLRPINDTDESFLFRVFVSGRPELLGLPRELAHLQFDTQRRQYATSNPAATEEVIEFEGEAVGRCIVSRVEGEYRLLDLCVVSNYRRRGIGGAVVSSLLARAAAASVPVRLSVWHANVDAFRFYRRLGLEPCGEHHGYLSMQTTSEPTQTTPERAVAG